MISTRQVQVVKPKTEELLYLLLWTCDMLARPTFRNMTDSFENWAYRNGFSRQLAELERQKFLESQPLDAGGAGPDSRAWRLSEAGRLHALGGRDPETQWRRQWDGHWRLVLFDLPNSQAATRDRLRRYLRQRGFGYLQNSVWVSPDPLRDEREILTGSKTNVESLLLLEARPCAGESDAEIVAGAWDFPSINRRYTRYRKVLSARPESARRDAAAATALRKWASTERFAWHEAISEDPLLPEALLPADYLGRIVWHERIKTLRQAAVEMRDFKS